MIPQEGKPNRKEYRIRVLREEAQAAIDASAEQIGIVRAQKLWQITLDYGTARVSGVVCQVSGVKCQVPGVRCQVPSHLKPAAPG